MTCVHCDQQECVCPPRTVLCWTCHLPIDEGMGRTKDAMRVHHLCPAPGGVA